MNTDAEYLKALADELMCPNMEADLDEEDGQRLYRIADAHDKLLAALRPMRDWMADNLECQCEIGHVCHECDLVQTATEAIPQAEEADMNVKCLRCGADINECDSLAEHCLGCSQQMVSQFCALVAKRDRLMAMLQRLEHQGRDVDLTPICPVCLATDLDPHYANCELNALLGEAQEQQS